MPGSGGSTESGGSITTGGVSGGGGIAATGGTSSAGGVTLTGGSAGGATTAGSATGGAAAGGNASGGSATGGSETGGSTGGGTAGACGGGVAATGDIVVNLGSALQRISGFGVSTAWTTTNLSDADADLVFSAEKGVGLSLLRIRITPDGKTSESQPAKQAQARGATVWAAPWSPAASYKSNNDVVGGSLTNGQAWADSLASFVTSMKSSGVDIYAVSAQNEPDANVSYESCSYSGSSLTSFIGTYLGPALASTSAKVMAPESQNWCGLPNYLPSLLSDASASKYVAIIATHEYGCSPKAYPEIAQAGKELWETEYMIECSGPDLGMTAGIKVAGLIHRALTVASMNAWHYWHLMPSSGGNCAGLFDYDAKAATKRLYVMGNYSKFVRPGFQRVGITGTVPSGLQVTAYQSPSDGTVVVVAINGNGNATSLSIFFSGGAPCSMTPWVTAASDDLAAKTAVQVTSSRFTFSLPAQSVTTFVGK
jgi:glucuronoarabinoxylan endo-1,4-beta-xylanase